MRRSLIVLAVFVICGTAGPVAHAAVPLKRELRTYSVLYHTVKRVHGARVPGRNIRRQGVRTSHGVRAASAAEVGRSIRTFRRWLAPPMGSAQAGDRVSAYPASAGGRWAIPSNIVQCESGGNYRVVNNSPAGQAAGRPAGAYQMTTSTWIGAGGGKYAPTADAATPAQQDEIAARVWDGGAGRGNWEC